MPQIDNSLLTCEHNNANPDKSADMKRISRSAWEALHVRARHAMIALECLAVRAAASSLFLSVCPGLGRWLMQLRPCFSEKQA